MHCEKIISKAVSGEKLSAREVKSLLSLSGPDERDMLFGAARGLRKKHFGNNVFLYGFIYFSTYCKNDCAFCNYRVSNGGERYRKTADEVVQSAVTLKDSGVHLIDLTMGEDAYYRQNPEQLLSLTALVKQVAGLPLMVSPGVVPLPLIDAFAHTGVDWYALYQETYSRRHFGEMRVNQDFDERMGAKRYAREKGILIEEGLLVGERMPFGEELPMGGKLPVGESPLAGSGDSFDRFADSLLEMGESGASQVRVMTYIPPSGVLQNGLASNGTVPSGTTTNGTAPNRAARINFDTEILAIAVMRLLYPDLLIPASLDVDGPSGLAERLNAGANVITSLIPPGLGLAGVANAQLGIESGSRTVDGISETIDKCGLRPAMGYEYENWLRGRKDKSFKL